MSERRREPEGRIGVKGMMLARTPMHAVEGKAERMADQDWPHEIHRLEAAQVTQISYVPDGGHRQLIELCTADPGMRVVSLTTEEEGVSLAAGAWLGGVRSVLLMQSSGVGNCVNALSLLRACQFPFLTLVTMRGDFGETNAWQMTMGQASQPVLERCGVVCLRVDTAAEVSDTVAAGLQMAYRGSQAIAILLSQRLIGAKTFQ